MQTKQYNWFKVAESTAEITQRGERSMIEIKLGAREICIVHYNETLHACSAKCPHAGGRLGQGFVDGKGNIVCPMHRYRFSLKNGINTSGEGYHLKTYPIREDEEGVFIGIEAGGI